MHNSLCIIGRIVNDEITVEETKNEKKMATVKIAVPRSFKNKDGIYETDFITVVLFDGVASNTAEYVRSGDLIGVRGRLSNLDENSNNLTVIADKISFLASQRKEA